MEEEERFVPKGCWVAFGCLSMILAPVGVAINLIDPVGKTPTERWVMRIVLVVAVLLIFSPAIMRIARGMSASRRKEASPPAPPGGPEEGKPEGS